MDTLAAGHEVIAINEPELKKRLIPCHSCKRKSILYLVMIFCLVFNEDLSKWFISKNNTSSNFRKWKKKHISKHETSRKKFHRGQKKSQNKKNWQWRRQALNEYNCERTKVNSRHKNAYGFLLLFTEFVFFSSWASLREIQWLHFSAGSGGAYDFRFFFLYFFVVVFNNNLTIHFSRVYIFGVKIIRISSRRMACIDEWRTMRHTQDRDVTINSTCDKSTYQPSMSELFFISFFLLFGDLPAVDLHEIGMLLDVQNN